MAATHIFGVLLLVISDCFVNCEEGWTGRTWQTNINYNNSRNWDAGRLPCDSDRIVLQRSESIVLQLPEGKHALRELVLPSYSGLVLPQNGVIQFTGLRKSSNCDGQDIIFKPVRPSRWVDVNNWDGWNPATPDLERIPCVSEAVQFPPRSTYKVILPDYVKVGTLKINDAAMTSFEFISAQDSLGVASPFQMVDGSEATNLDITGYTCDATQWCECGNEYLHSQVCSGLPCSEPLCQQPIQPRGFCCPLCGSYFLMESSSHSNKRQLADHINSFLRDKGVFWHASKVEEDIQVVLVETEEYTGKVTDVAQSLKTSLARSGLGWTTKEFHGSGHVLYPTTFGQVVVYFFSLMVAAALILAGIIVFYSNHWSWMSFSTLEGRSFMFARFENQSGEVVVTSEERQTPNTFQPQTFDNPMYDATRQVTVEAPEYTEITDSLDTQSVEDLTKISE